MDEQDFIIHADKRAMTRVEKLTFRHRNMVKSRYRKMLRDIEERNRSKVSLPYVAIFITTRIGSTRLPKKAKLMVTERQTVTDVLIERMKKVPLPIWLVVPNTVEDIVAFTYQSNVHKVRLATGDEENILKRHFEIARRFKFPGNSWIINIDGDDILAMSPIVIDLVGSIAMYDDNRDIDCVTTRGLPLGLNVFAYRYSYLKEKWPRYRCDTGWGEYLLRGTTCGIVEYQDWYDKARLTLDYKEDYELIKHIICKCKNSDTKQGMKKILKNKRLLSINRFRNEEYWERYNTLIEQKGLIKHDN